MLYTLVGQVDGSTRASREASQGQEEQTQEQTQKAQEKAETYFIRLRQQLRRRTETQGKSFNTHRLLAALSLMCLCLCKVLLHVNDMAVTVGP